MWAQRQSGKKSSTSGKYSLLKQVKRRYILRQPYVVHSNLGPYMHALELLVYVIGKHQIQAVGKVEVPLPTIRRNVATEDWYEVQPSEHASKKGHFEMPGELNLRVLVKEDISLPFQLYSKLGSVSQWPFIRHRDASQLTDLLERPTAASRGFRLNGSA